MLLPYLSEFIHQNPHFSISISCQSTNETLRLLDDNKIDIGLIGKSENFKGFQFDFLGNIEDTFVASPEYLSNLKERGIKEEEILEHATLMLLDKNNLTRKYIDTYFQNNLIDVSDTIDISDMGLLIDFAKIGVGVACVIKSFVSKDLNRGKLVEIPLELPIPTREVGFAYKENVKPSKALESFIEFYKTYEPSDE